MSATLPYQEYATENLNALQVCCSCGSGAMAPRTGFTGSLNRAKVKVPDEKPHSPTEIPPHENKEIPTALL